MKYQHYTKNTLFEIPQYKTLSDALKLELLVSASFYHFKTNNYVIDELIDWKCVPDDPHFKMTFPNKKMFNGDDFDALVNIFQKGNSQTQFTILKQKIRKKMVHIPAQTIKQFTPSDNLGQIRGMYHQFSNVLMLAPRKALDCYAYCTYCYRWAVMGEDGPFGYDDPDCPLEYLKKNPQITDVLITGGDPFCMSAADLKSFVSPILSIPTVTTIRFGTKMLTWWPYRFCHDEDCEELIALLSEIRQHGKNISIMAHFSHPKELTTDAVNKAIEKILGTGAMIKCQNPIIKDINDNSDCIANLWKKCTSVGVMPYYLFIEGNNDNRDCFKIPLFKALEIYNNAIRSVSGISATAKGPIITHPGSKTVLVGITEVNGKQMFVLKHIRHWNQSEVGKVFFRDYDPLLCDLEF